MASGDSASDGGDWVSVRALLSSREAGSIIGKGGEAIASIRSESGAKIHISDGQSRERVATVAGGPDQVVDAFAKMANRLEEEGHADNQQQQKTDNTRRSRSSSSSWSVTLRLIIPASVCGSLIGKGGSKIREIRDSTNAFIHIGSDQLPNSTDRAITITGNEDALTKSLSEICKVVMEAPAKPNSVPYQPSRNGGGAQVLGTGGSRISSDARVATPSSNPLSGLLSLGNGASALAALASLASSQLRDGNHRGEHHRSAPTSTHEMYIPNELIGCVIGKGGSKIAEIRQISGASICISRNDDTDSSNDNKGERHISICGSGDAVALAKSLITMSVDMHKARLEENGRREENGRNDDVGHHRMRDDNSSNGSRGSSSERIHFGNRNFASPTHNLGELNGLAALLSQPEAINALTTLASFSQLGLLGGLNNDRTQNHANSAQRGRNRGGSPNGHYRGSSNYHRSDCNEERSNTRRSKFTPY